MALPRNFLEQFDLPKETVDKILAAHWDTVTALKERIETLENQDQGLAEITAERDDLKKKLEALETSAKDAEKVQAAFDAYKAEAESEKARNVKRRALDELLRDRVGVQRDEFRRVILDGANLDDFKLDDGGALLDADALASSLGQKYAAFVGHVQTTGSQSYVPPDGGGNPTKKDIMDIRDPVERQAAIAKNMPLFRKE